MFARFSRSTHTFRRLSGGVVALTALYAIAAGVRIGDGDLGRWVDDIGLAVTSAASGIVALYVSRRRVERSRRAWTILGAACLLWSAGEITWSVYELILNRAMPFPSVADAFYIGGTVSAIVGVMYLVPREEHLSGMARRLLDGCILGASLLLVSWVVILKDVLKTTPSGSFALGVSLAYPIADVITLALVISIATHSQGRRRQALTILAAGMATQAVTDSLFVGLAAHNSYTGGFVDAGWFLGYLLIGLAAFRKLSAGNEEAEPTSPLRLMNILVPFAAATGSMALAIEQEMAGREDRVLSWCGSAIIIMVLVRLMLTIADNMSLARSLEHKVAERTEELSSRERLFRSLVQNSSDVITILSADGVIRAMGDSARDILKVEPDAVAGERLVELVHPDDIASTRAAVETAAKKPSGSFAMMEFRMLCGDGRWRSLETKVANLLDDPAVKGLVLNSRDVSERKSLETELKRQAFHDSLTGLANRALFQERIDHALKRRDRLDAPLAVLFIDLDNFKAINDSYGHETGDELLRQFALRLEKCTRPGDTAARLGGDEFGILLEQLPTTDAPMLLAQRCLDAVQAPFSIDGRRIGTDISIGVAISSALETADEILRNADVAMYEVKTHGGGNYQVFDHGLHAALIRRVELGRDLRGALERGELTLRYQPVYALNDERLEGAEALIRWEHPSRGMIMPSEFIPIAEETGLIIPIGEWVLRTAVATVRHWQGFGGAARGLTMAVNISARQLQEEDFPIRVNQIICAGLVDPSRVILEITESAVIQDTEEMIGRLHELKGLGVSIAIDDFGTGYSSLSYLRRLPVDILKIDRSFVGSVDQGIEDSALVKAIVKLSSTFGLHTIVEGIERPEQAETLREMGCDSAQGFLYARPVSDIDFEAMVVGQDQIARTDLPSGL